MMVMSEKRFICGLGFPINSDDPIRIIRDSVEDKDYYKFSDICNVLNEQHSIIRRDEISIQTMMSNMKKLEEKNEQLRKENVFLAKQRTYWKSKCAEWMGVKEENLSLGCVKMSEERFKSKYYLKGKQGVVLGVVKVNEEENVLHWNEVVELLNRLNDENEQLRKELDNFKPVMFQDMQRGTVRLYSKGDVDE